MKICVINPPYLHKHYSTEMDSAPLPCLAYLGSTLKHMDHHVVLIDAKLEGLTTKDLLNRVSSIKPDVVAISIVTTDMPIARKIATAVKAMNQNTLVIVGGAHPSALPREILISEKSFDIAVIGEGETTFPHLINTIEKNGDLTSVEGIAYRQYNELKLTPPRKHIDDLDEIPLPLWTKMPPGEMYYIQVSRGCPYQCSFCYRLFGQKVRVNSPGRIIKEIQSILKYTTPKEFFFSAATFGLPKNHSLQLFDALIDSGLNKKIKWRAATRPGLHDYEFFAKMKEAGCYSVGFGIESGDEEILKKTSKDTKLQHIHKSVNMAKEVGLKTVGFFIMGHPFETKESALRTSNFAIDLNPTTVTIGIMTPWPGSKVHEMALKGQGGYILDQNQSIEGQHKHYGKRTLHFKDVKLSYIQWLRIRTYLLLYFKNKRFFDGITFIIDYLRDGIFFLKEAFGDLISKR